MLSAQSYLHADNRFLYGENELTGAVKSIVNPHLVIGKNETTYGKQK